jgi:copper chaperone
MTYQFKTNINCSSCVDKITPHLKNQVAILSWNVDTENKDKLLKVSTDELSPNDIVEIVKNAGFKITGAKKKTLWDKLFNNGESST